MNPKTLALQVRGRTDVWQLIRALLAVQYNLSFIYKTSRLFFGPSVSPALLVPCQTHYSVPCIAVEDDEAAASLTLAVRDHPQGLHLCARCIVGLPRP